MTLTVPTCSSAVVLLSFRPHGLADTYLIPDYEDDPAEPEGHELPRPTVPSGFPRFGQDGRVMGDHGRPRPRGESHGLVMIK